MVVTAEFYKYATKTSQTSLLDLFSNAIKTGATSTASFSLLTEQIEFMQYGLYGVVVLTALLIGLVATRLALEPVRDSLIAQKRFIESIAHELRTSLAVLKTQNEVAKMDTEVVGAAEETLDQNIKEIDHITEILNNLLLFNRVDTIENIVFDLVNLEEVIETVILRLRRLAEHKDISVIFEKSVIPPVYGNATGLEQMLFNLVKNGIMYTPQNGAVTISCTAVTENEVTLRVSDTGIGIDKEELPHIFKLFYRTDKVQEMSKGAGVGLALVYEIVKLHNGKIQVNSTPGAGTRFDISLPRRHVGGNSKEQAHEGAVAYDFSADKNNEDKINGIHKE